MQREQAMTNCPNCGAVLNYDGGLHCDYCGAVFERPRVECAVKIHSPEVGEDMLRMLARGLGGGSLGLGSIGLGFGTTCEAGGDGQDGQQQSNDLFHNSFSFLCFGCADVLFGCLHYTLPN